MICSDKVNFKWLSDNTAFLKVFQMVTLEMPCFTPPVSLICHFCSPPSAFYLLSGAWLVGNTQSGCNYGKKKGKVEIAEWLWWSRCGPVEEHLWQQFSTWTLPPQGLSYPSHSAAAAPTPPCVSRLAASTGNALASNNRLKKETELGCRQERERVIVKSRD